MKILLYEPGDTGHRPVILRYTIKVLEQARIDWAHAGSDCGNSAWVVVKRAQELGCDLIYVLTVDGIVGFTWWVSLIARFYGIRVICTYYLFNNLSAGWKSWVWRVLLFTGNISRVHISDERLKRGHDRYPKQAWFLPDPWDPDEFPEWTQEAARKRLGITNGATVFLMFGLIDERKGADMFLQASLALAEKRPARAVVFLLAGQMSPGVRKLFDKCCQYSGGNYSWIGIDRRMPEDEVSIYYYATDYLLCAYPPYFKVSSNTVTRALAAGRPIIVPSHGVNAALVNDCACGLLFHSGSLPALIETLAEAAELRCNDIPRYEKMCEVARQTACSRGLNVYGTHLCLSIDSLMHRDAFRTY